MKLLKADNCSGCFVLKFLFAFFLVSITSYTCEISSVCLFSFISLCFIFWMEGVLAERTYDI